MSQTHQIFFNIYRYIYKYIHIFAAICIRIVKILEIFTTNPTDTVRKQKERKKTKTQTNRIENPWMNESLANEFSMNCIEIVCIFAIKLKWQSWMLMTYWKKEKKTLQMNMVNSEERNERKNIWAKNTHTHTHTKTKEKTTQNSSIKKNLFKFHQIHQMHSTMAHKVQFSEHRKWRETFCNAPSTTNRTKTAAVVVVVVKLGTKSFDFFFSFLFPLYFILFVRQFYFSSLKEEEGKIKRYTFHSNAGRNKYFV